MALEGGGFLGVVRFRFCGLALGPNWAQIGQTGLPGAIGAGPGRCVSVDHPFQWLGSHLDPFPTNFIYRTEMKPE
jgi:hypothetical protein